MNTPAIYFEAQKQHNQYKHAYECYMEFIEKLQSFAEFGENIPYRFKIYDAGDNYIFAHKIVMFNKTISLVFEQVKVEGVSYAKIRFIASCNNKEQEILTFLLHPDYDCIIYSLTANVENNLDQNTYNSIDEVTISLLTSQLIKLK